VFRTQRDGSVKILNVNLASALDANPLENVIVQPRDRIIVHRSLFRVDPPSVYIRGEVVNPGRYPLAENMQVAGLLRAAGGPKRSADLHHGDLTRYSAASGIPAGSERHPIDLTALSMIRV
jgi:protein involved in polysaccharide export with SLBB domain